MHDLTHDLYLFIIRKASVSSKVTHETDVICIFLSILYIRTSFVYGVDGRWL